MDQVARNNFGAALYFNKVAPDAPRRVFHNLTKLANQPNVLPKLVILHPPELSTFYSRGQKKPINIFKKLVPKLESGCKGSGQHGYSGMKERSEQKTGSWDVQWTPPSVKPSDALSVESGLSSSLYSPQTALIEALGLAFDRVIAIEPLSYGEGVQHVEFSCSNVKPTRSQARFLRRKSRYPHPMILSPAPQRSQASPAPSKKIPRGMPGSSLRKPSSSSRRTSRSLMFGHDPKKPTYTYRRQPPSIFSSLSSIIQAVEIDQPLTGIHGRRPSSRHIQALKRTSKVLPPPAKSILPPLEIHPLTFSPFIAEFSDHASSNGDSSAPSTPSITTPPNDVVSLAYVSPQKEIRGQRDPRRYGRCPSDFLNLGPNIPIASPIEQSRTDIVLALTVSTPPPRFDSLRGYSRASLEKAMEVAEKTKAEETKSIPSKASLRPKLTLEFPKTSGPSQRSVIHRPVASIRHCTDDIKIDTRRPRPLPTIPITREQSM